MTIRPVDLFLSSNLGEGDAQRYLGARGFRDPAAADGHLRAMADDPVVRQALGALAEPLLDALSRSPDPDQAVVGFSRYLSARTSRLLFLDYLRDDPGALRVLADILGTSPFLADILVRNPEYFHALRTEVDRPRPSPLAETAGAGPGETSTSRSALNALKRLKRQRILGIAARDLLGRDALPAVGHQLAALAGALVDRALAVVTRDRLAEAGRRKMPGSFAVIGMGKLGGDELNYSSDIDLVYVYDPIDEDDDAGHEFFHRLARKLTTALSDHTEESYLYRVDLRLRAMGRGGAVAHSLRQLRGYYETMGETFERFALIKARPVAGDSRLGKRFVEMVQPFVYRKYLDYAALEELYQYKARSDRSIERSMRDRNVKVGWGGIREVELFAQVLQLTYGARAPALRQPNTLAALSALVGEGLVSREVGDELTEAYVFLRTVEHRLQIVQEQQTHTLAEAADELDRCARRLRFDSAEAMTDVLDAHRRRVHDVYRGLFDRQAGSDSYEARELFRILGDETSDASAAAFFSDHALRDPSAVVDAVRALGRQAGTTAAQAPARNVLANLLAVCLPRLARSGRPASVLVRLDRFSAGAGGIGELGRSLLENDVLRDALVDVLDSGELLAERLIRRPELLDSLVHPARSASERRRSIDADLDAIRELERDGRMDRLRRVVQNEELKILVEWLAVGSLDRLQGDLSLLAERATAHAAAWHAPVSPKSRAASWAVVALGKLGGAELSAHSDLDLVFVYDDPGDPQDAGLRWQRFVEETQDFLSRLTPEGSAYRIDTRLRPEGTKGPLAIPFAAFLRYLAERAEPWERLAWTRGRVIAGSRGLTARIAQATDRFVYGPWDPSLPGYMRHVRERMESELAKESESKRDFKTGKGGLADIDFLLQLLQIREGHDRREFRIRGSRRLLAALPGTTYLSSEELDRLRTAHARLRTLEMFVRMEADAGISSISLDGDALLSVARRMGFSDGAGERLLSWYDETTTSVRSLYAAVLSRLESG